MSEKGCLKDLRVQNLEITKKCVVKIDFQINNFKFPKTNGLDNQLLTTDGNGNLTWQNSETSLGIYDTINELPTEDLEGKLTYVKDVNNIYLNKKNDDDTLGWYKIKTVGDVPSFTSTLNSSYQFNNTDTNINTQISLSGTDPDAGDSVTFSFVTVPTYSVQTIFNISLATNILTINSTGSNQSGDNIKLIVVIKDNNGNFATQTTQLEII